MRHVGAGAFYYKSVRRASTGSTNNNHINNNENNNNHNNVVVQANNNNNRQVVKEEDDRNHSGRWRSIQKEKENTTNEVKNGKNNNNNNNNHWKQSLETIKTRMEEEQQQQQQEQQRQKQQQTQKKHFDVKSCVQRLEHSHVNYKVGDTGFIKEEESAFKELNNIKADLQYVEKERSKYQEDSERLSNELYKERQEIEKLKKQIMNEQKSSKIKLYKVNEELATYKLKATKATNQQQQHQQEKENNNKEKNNDNNSTSTSTTTTTDVNMVEQQQESLVKLLKERIDAQEARINELEEFDSIGPITASQRQLQLEEELKISRAKEKQLRQEVTFSRDRLKTCLKALEEKKQPSLCLAGESPPRKTKSTTTTKKSVSFACSTTTNDNDNDGFDTIPTKKKKNHNNNNNEQEQQQDNIELILIQDENKLLQREVEDAEMQLITTQNALDISQEREQTLEKEIDILKQSIATLESTKQQINISAETKIRWLSAENNNLKNEIQTRETLHISTNKFLQESKQREFNIQEQYDTLKDEYTKLDLSKTKLNETIEIKLRSLTKENKKLKNELKTDKIKSNSTQIFLNDSKERENALQEQINQLKGSYNEIETSKQKLDLSAEIKIQWLTTENNNLKNELSTNNVIFNSMKQSLNESKEREQSLINKIDILQKTISELEVLKHTPDAASEVTSRWVRKENELLKLELQAAEKLAKTNKKCLDITQQRESHLKKEIQFLKNKAIISSSQNTLTLNNVSISDEKIRQLYDENNNLKSQLQASELLSISSQKVLEESKDRETAFQIEIDHLKKTIIDLLGLEVTMKTPLATIAADKIQQADRLAIRSHELSKNNNNTNTNSTIQQQEQKQQEEEEDQQLLYHDDSHSCTTKNEWEHFQSDQQCKGIEMYLTPVIEEETNEKTKRSWHKYFPPPLKFIFLRGGRHTKQQQKQQSQNQNYHQIDDDGYNNKRSSPDRSIDSSTISGSIRTISTISPEKSNKNNEDVVSSSSSVVDVAALHERIRESHERLSATSSRLKGLSQISDDTYQQNIKIRQSCASVIKSVEETANNVEIFEGSVTGNLEVMARNDVDPQ